MGFSILSLYICILNNKKVGGDCCVEKHYHNFLQLLNVRAI